MTPTQLLLPLLLVALTVVAVWMVTRLARQRVQPSSGAGAADDPLVTWVASLRHSTPPTGPGRGVVRDVARSKPAGTRPQQRGQGHSAGPPSRRDSRRPSRMAHPMSGARQDGAVSGAWSAGPPPRSAWYHPLAAAPRRTLVLSGVLAAAVGALLGGPVAAVVTGAYGTLGVRALLRRRATRQADQLRRRHLDQLCDLAADLRAGLPVGQSTALSTAGGPGGTLIRAAVRLADRTGAPLADLLDRIDVDARAADRGRATAAAQAAGARATAWLLAALPIGGIALGYGIGVDPVAVLLHSAAGGSCAVLAVVLQVAGLFWTERLTAVPGGELG
ncbi:type II secretion system F family protein [Salinispora vitiensis]|uniref:type II secretion system F family protein n=1 Tax=Salinispora vitiensis TaxID=999544 RepID=UPI00035E0FBC|nr:hypothetical protein [Salinispora vitiensis]